MNNLKYKEIKFTRKETKFLHENEICRVATSSTDREPHVIPVCYLFIDNSFYFATDYNTKNYRNLRNNKVVALVVDVYNPPGNKAVAITGTAIIIEAGRKFNRIFQIFYEGFEWVKKEPWQEGEAPFIEVRCLRKVSWGIT